MLAKELLEREARSRSLVSLGSQCRTVLAHVPGRREGESPIEKDERGLPLRVKPDPADNVESGSGSDGNRDHTTLDKQKRKLVPDDDRQGAVHSSETSRKRAKGRRGEVWKVPYESDDEDEHDECAYMAEYGYRAVHDFWPSQSRQVAYMSIYDDRTNKTVRAVPVITFEFLLNP